MFKCSSRFLNPLHKVSLLLGVYALHLFLFLGLTVFSTSSFAGQSNFRIPTGSSHANHDPASVECRSLFKYDDSKQEVKVAHFPIAAEFYTASYCNISIGSPVNNAPHPPKLSDEVIKRYRLLGVFLI